ncbi:hypothetical protein BpHYR1_020206 [Brachionus plicatilis]|uniref:Uncharacterized protein n=1 Tax=Brachionus plicatilis TaxID=10195 RepID=A0A3M7RIK1_BRAPC|nr:hypothetical protein BpHYR1_020206 [Brachionus plicatilis]
MIKNKKNKSNEKKKNLAFEWIFSIECHINFGKINSIKFVNFRKITVKFIKIFYLLAKLETKTDIKVQCALYELNQDQIIVYEKKSNNLKNYEIKK